MRLLLVEDEEELISIVQSQLDGIVPPVSLDVASSRNSAVSMLESRTFDLVVCDLHIPSEDGALDHDVEHGLAVHTLIASTYSGTPVLILSGFAEIEMMEELIPVAHQFDIFGTSDSFPMLQYLPKTKLHECIDRIAHFSAEIGALGDIVVEGPDRESLGYSDRKLLRIYARRVRGVHMEVSDLPGGLSGNRALMVNVFDQRNSIQARTVTKIGEIEDVLDELDRCKRIITPLLIPGNYAPPLDTVEAGAGSVGAVIYRRDDGYEQSLFDVLESDPAMAAGVVDQIREIEAPWIEAATYDNFKMREVREWFLQDDSILTAKLPGIGWEEFEERSTRCRVGSQHGDLHPGNVLVSEHGKPIFIDYGRATAQGSIGMDPVSLELSVIFHPRGRKISGSWPSAREASNWQDIDRYTANSPIGDFVRACRDWAGEACSSYREVFAVAYGYSVRQLKFPNTNHETAREIASAAITAFD